MDVIHRHGSLIIRQELSNHKGLRQALLIPELHGLISMAQIVNGIRYSNMTVTSSETTKTIES